jgi:hydrogenase maturation protease
LRVRIENRVSLDDGNLLNRDEALMRSLVSTHTILEVDRGEFVSLLDPPEAERALAAGCQNIGAWPVLVGEIGQKDTILSSPIILYDYPQVAPESPGDLFDSTEIDEILILRILTLTDAEKQAAAAVDERVRALLYRNESLAMDQLRGLHGAVRGLQMVKQGGGHE